MVDASIGAKRWKNAVSRIQASPLTPADGAWICGFRHKTTARAGSLSGRASVIGCKAGDVGVRNKEGLSRDQTHGSTRWSGSERVIDNTGGWRGMAHW